MWGRGRFPVLSQLNILTTPAHIDATRKFFTATYGRKRPYQVGDLCYDWKKNRKPNPPWQGDTDNPWNLSDVRAWRIHCRRQLKIHNAGLDQGRKSNNRVFEDLTNWIREAILAKQQIVYKYRRSRTLKGEWKADRDKSKTGWLITVTGPGF